MLLSSVWKAVGTEQGTAAKNQALKAPVYMLAVGESEVYETRMQIIESQDALGWKGP